MRIHSLAAITAVALATAAVADERAATLPALTLQDALGLASNGQPAVEAYTREAEASEEAAVAARSLPDPKVSVGIQNYPVTGDNALSPTDAMMTMYTIGVMREQVRRSRREAEAAQLRAEASVSRFQGSVRERQIQREVMKAWVDAVEARAKQRLFERIIGDLRTGQKVIESAVSTGGSSAALALEAQAEVSLAQAQLSNAKGAEERARGMLRRWIGAAADSRLPDELPRLSPPAGIGTPTFDIHPEILVANAQERAAQRQVNVAREARKPDISWSVMIGVRPKYGEMIGGSVSIPLQINRRNLQDRRIAEAQARTDAARLRAEDTRRELAGQYDQAMADYRGAEAQMKQIRDGAIPALEQSFNAAEARVEGGQGTFQLPLEIVRRYVEAHVQFVEHEGARDRAVADLIYFSGEPAK